MTDAGIGEGKRKKRWRDASGSEQRDQTVEFFFYLISFFIVVILSVVRQWW